MTDDKKENNEGIKPFQVVDRRRFDSDGNDRTEGVEARPAAPEATETKTGSAAPVSRDSAPRDSVPEAPPMPGKAHADLGEDSEAVLLDADTDADTDAEPDDQEFRPEASENPDEDVTLSSFIMSLATQTMVQLGEMDPPPGMEIPPDPESARQTIDIISMLQRMTRGNVSSEEARFMKDVLHTLRMSYVRRAQ